MLLNFDDAIRNIEYKVVVPGHFGLVDYVNILEVLASIGLLQMISYRLGLISTTTKS